MNTELDLICRRCRQPITSGHGCLWVSFAEIRIANRERDDLGADIAWKVHHDGCTPDPGDAYSVEAAQISTWAGLARWTSHLMAKNWFAFSDWDELLREAAGESTESPRIMARVRSVA